MILANIGRSSYRFEHNIQSHYSAMLGPAVLRFLLYSLLFLISAVPKGNAVCGSVLSIHAINVAGNLHI